MMKNLQINNYKSIRQLDLSCSRINVLVGEPNTGKSNILEALDLNYLSGMIGRNNEVVDKETEKINIKEYFRVNKAAELFHLGNIEQPILINGLRLQFNGNKKNNIFEINYGNVFTEFDNDFAPLEDSQYFGSPIHPYRYEGGITFHDKENFLNILMPPYGNNLLEVIQYNPSFRALFEVFAKEYGFEFNFDVALHKLYIQLKVNKGLVYSIPWKGIADTFKRFLFYVTAVRYNNAQTITLDEPDVHSFPKYVSFLADEIVQNDNCQFFISTHNPYLLNNLIENTPKGQLSVFVCGYNKNRFETTVKKLSNEDLSELLNYGVDIFFNINRYLDERFEHSS